MPSVSILVHREAALVRARRAALDAGLGHPVKHRAADHVGQARARLRRLEPARANLSWDEDACHYWQIMTRVTTDRDEQQALGPAHATDFRPRLFRHQHLRRAVRCAVIFLHPFLFTRRILIERENGSAK